MAKATSAVPKDLQTMTPQLTLDDAAQSIEWYKKAFGAEEVYRSTGPDGKVMHAQVKIGNSSFMCNDVMMDDHHKGPKGHGGSPVAFWLYVDDCDALFTRALDAGAKVAQPMEDQFWGDRAGAIKDPAGYSWWIATHKEDLSHGEVNRRAEAHFAKLAQATR
jgi:PhnB protein